MVHLDTDIVIAYLNGNRDVAERLRASRPGAGVSTLVVGELLFGAKVSKRAEENRTKVSAFLTLVDIVPSTNAVRLCSLTSRPTSAGLAGRPVRWTR